MTLRNASIRARGEYSPLWLLVPVVLLAVVLAGSMLTMKFGGIDDAQPVFVDSIDNGPIPLEQHGA